MSQRAEEIVRDLLDSQEELSESEQNPISDNIPIPPLSPNSEESIRTQPEGIDSSSLN